MEKIIVCITQDAKCDQHSISFQLKMAILCTEIEQLFQMFLNVLKMLSPVPYHLHLLCREKEEGKIDRKKSH